MSKNAILEIGVEHLPSRFVGPALQQIGDKTRTMLSEERLRCKTVSTCGTLRRLTVILEGIEEKSDPLEKKTLGPSAKLLKDPNGNFTPQALGFAKSQGVDVEKLEVVTSPKGEVLQACKVIPGEAAAKVLARLFSGLIKSLQFPKNMEWEESRFRFARPIRNLLALHGRKVVPIELAGIRSSNKALGATIGAKPILIEEAGKYAQKLRLNCVLVHYEDRKQALTKAIDHAMKRLKAKVDLDDGLLDEIVYLTEHPVPVVGSFQKEFLGLPKALLTIVLKKQLKFFPVIGERGELLPHLVGVRDGISEGQKEVQEGFERVLEARFNDARFFYERDRKSRLEEKAEKLKGVLFQKGLGTLWDKTERVVACVGSICDVLEAKEIQPNRAAAERIARLAYADLVTEIVKEFPELQGIMGGHYARADGESERVAVGVEEFYYPLSAKSPLSGTLEASIASLAGKIDTLAALFSAGLKPSGSEDPFALRRAGTAIVRIIIEKQLPLDLLALAERSFGSIAPMADFERKLEVLNPKAPQKPISLELIYKDLTEFLWQRFENWFEEIGYAADEIRAVSENGLRDLPRTFKRLAAVHALRPNQEFLTLASTFKRAANILKQAKNGAESHNVDATLFDEEGEKSLHEAIERVQGSVSERLAREEFEDALKELLALKPFVDKFFDTVRVMDAAETVKTNRLALLGRLVRLFKSVADLSTLQAS